EQITEMVHHLGISTVVEGVETEENDRMIHEMGCDFGQGYYYSRPIPAQEFSERFMQGR
ncbi:MAG TPA: EAL domain-containing protein, partial [Candidatus Faecivivens stercorigallinarum]|nr:EAL domain-containing protein [Candidatus Faecivivens stercorigallinarum]